MCSPARPPSLRPAFSPRARCEHGLIAVRPTRASPPAAWCAEAMSGDASHFPGQAPTPSVAGRRTTLPACSRDRVSRRLSCPRRMPLRRDDGDRQARSPPPREAQSRLRLRAKCEHQRATADWEYSGAPVIARTPQRLEPRCPSQPKPRVLPRWPDRAYVPASAQTRVRANRTVRQRHFRSIDPSSANFPPRPLCPPARI